MAHQLSNRASRVNTLMLHATSGLRVFSPPFCLVGVCSQLWWKRFSLLRTKQLPPLQLAAALMANADCRAVGVSLLPSLVAFTSVLCAGWWISVEKHRKAGCREQVPWWLSTFLPLQSILIPGNVPLSKGRDVAISYSFHPGTQQQSLVSSHVGSKKALGCCMSLANWTKRDLVWTSHWEQWDILLSWSFNPHLEHKTKTINKSLKLISLPLMKNVLAVLKMHQGNCKMNPKPFPFVAVTWLHGSVTAQLPWPQWTSTCCEDPYAKRNGERIHGSSVVFET